MIAAFGLVIGVSFLFAADDCTKDKEKKTLKGHDKKTREMHMKKADREMGAEEHEKQVKRKKEGEHRGHKH